MLPWKWARTQKKNFIFNILNPLTNSIADLYCQSLWNHMFYNEKSFYVVHMFYQRKHKRKATGIHRQMKGPVAERKQIFTRVSSSQQYKKIKITKKKKKEEKGEAPNSFIFTSILKSPSQAQTTSLPNFLYYKGGFRKTSTDHYHPNTSRVWIRVALIRVWMHWVFSIVSKDNILQLLVGLSLAPKPNLLWINAVFEVNKHKFIRISALKSL